MDSSNLLDILWIVVASALVFVMQAGFAMVESGLTRSKNSINVAIKNLTDLGVSLLSFWIVGFGIMFGLSFKGLAGSSLFFFEPLTTWGSVFFLFHAMFCSTSATIVSGAVAERMKYSSYIISTVLLSLMIYPVFGHWIWGGALGGELTGWLGKRGFIDFAGSTVVHSLGGWIALAILLIIGPRSGRYNEKGARQEINGSNIPMVVLGVIILWFGWFGFNGGSTMEMNGDVPVIIVKTSLSAAAGMIGSLILGWPLRKKPDVTLVMNGALAGLVAITAPVHAVSTAESVFIGLIGGALMIAAEELLWKLKIDDAVSAIPVHLVAGIWGTMSVAFFGDPAILGTGLSRSGQIIIQALGVLSCGLWAFGTAFLLLFIMNKIKKLRVTPEEEKSGLNMAEHGVTTEILDLYVTMDSQSRTGDLSLRAPVEPFTEAGQIAGMYNKVLDNLEANTVEKSAYLDILENINDGIFLLMPNRSIGPYYSKAMEDIFHMASLAGYSLEEVLSYHLSEEDQGILQEFLNVCFDKSIAWRHCEILNPLQDVSIFVETEQGRSETKHLSFQFKRIKEKKEITELLVMVTDVTTEKELSIEVEKTRKESRSEMELLYKILHIEPETMMEFLYSLDKELDQINKGFQLEGGSHRMKLEETFLHTHTIKGEAELLQVDFIAEKGEELEQQIQNILKQKEIKAEDFLPLTLIFSELQKTAGKVRALLNKWLNIDTETSQPHHRKETVKETFSKQLKEMTSRLAKQYGKEVELTVPDNLLDRLKEEQQKKMRNILVQLIRNSIYHGIESPAERVKKGKNSQGQIVVHFDEEESTYSFSVKDDGNGINSKKLADKAASRGIIENKGGTLNNAELMDILFSSGVSTADKPDRVAGKGVGMGLIRSLIKDLKGNFRIQSKKSLFTDFTIQIPKEVLN